MEYLIGLRWNSRNLYDNLKIISRVGVPLRGVFTTQIKFSHCNSCGHKNNNRKKLVNIFENSRADPNVILLFSSVVYLCVLL